jgi:hypothetical protein
MRTIFIDAFNQKIEEVNLPIEVAAFQKEIRRLLRTENWEIIHANEIVTVIFDKLALSKDTPSFWVGLLSDCPIFSNVICVGRNPFTQEMKDLDDVYPLESFYVRWFDKSTTENYRKIIAAFTQINLK